MKNQMFMGASTKQGYDIATKSREIIRGLIGDDIKDLAPAEEILLNVLFTLQLIQNMLNLYI